MINPVFLRKQDVITELDALRERRQRTANVVCTSIAVIAGIVQAVAQMILSVIGLSTLKYEDAPCPTNNPEHHHQQVIAEDTPILVLSAIGMSTFIAAGPLAGGAIYGIGMAVAWFFALRPLENLKEKIQIDYAAMEAIEADDIKLLCSEGDDQFLINIIKKMDFEQLYQANKELGDETFSRLNEITEIREWKSVGQVNERNIDEFRAQFVLEPYFFKAVEERASGSFKSLLGSLKVTDLATDDPKQNIIRNGRDLFNYCFCLIGDETDVVKFDKEIKLFLSSDASVLNEYINKVLSEIVLSEDIKKLLNGDVSVLNDQTIVSILKEADHWSLTRIVSIIDKYLNTYRNSFSEDMLIDLIDEYPDLVCLRTSLSKKYLRHADNVSSKVKNQVLANETFELFDRNSKVMCLKNYWELAVSGYDIEMKRKATNFIKIEMEREKLNPSAQFHELYKLYRTIVNEEIVFSCAALKKIAELGAGNNAQLLIAKRGIANLLKAEITNISPKFYEVYLAAQLILEPEELKFYEDKVESLPMLRELINKPERNREPLIESIIKKLIKREKLNPSEKYCEIYQLAKQNLNEEDFTNLVERNLNGIFLYRLCQIDKAHPNFLSELGLKLIQNELSDPTEYFFFLYTVCKETLSEEDFKLEVLDKMSAAAREKVSLSA